jgi:pimeloyl-ACP methyl ester carboxylesterase
MAFAEVNGQRIHFEDTGGDGPVLVFSHGLLMDGSMWDPQVVALRGRYRCITWDERGHGRTEADGTSFSYWDSARDLLALLAHLNVARATLIGMSQGGYLTQRAAVEAPELAQALVFVASQSGPEDPGNAALYETLLESWERDGLGDDLARAVATIVLGDGWSGSAEWIAKWRQMDVSSLRGVIEPLFGREDFSSRLGELDHPALVIWGDQDAAISGESARALAEGLPQGSLAVVPGAGHGVNLTHPEETNRALEAFLASGERAAS